jgi:hypothetical protein
MQVLSQAAVAHLLEAEHSLDDTDHCECVDSLLSISDPSRTPKLGADNRH